MQPVSNLIRTSASPRRLAGAPHRRLALPGALALLASGALGQISSTSGQITQIAAPASVENNVLEADGTIFVFEEAIDVTLSAPLAVNVIEPGQYPTHPLSPGTIPAKTVVSSFMLHSDQTGSGVTTVSAAGVVTFEDPVIGVMLDVTELAASDVLNPATVYAGSLAFRGMELTPNEDWIRISGRSVYYRSRLQNVLDNVRILTAKSRFMFSDDFGSDVDFADPFLDGDEVLDPGDVYLGFPGGPAGLFLNDVAYLAVTNPDSAVPVAPVGVGCSPGPPVCYNGVYDLDGFDRVNLPASIFQNDGPFFRNQLQSLAQGYGVYVPTNVAVSFDDDANPGWSPMTGMPPQTLSPAGNLYGQTANDDEVVRLNVSLTGTVLGTFPMASETGVAAEMAPNPDVSPQDDDDIDALDWLTSDTSLVLFSADHEGTGGGLSPAVIYTLMAGAPVPLITPADLGLPMNMDIDAFELAWLPINQQQGAPLALALLFSGDTDDPLTAMIDESGGLLPGAIYASFLDGSHFLWVDGQGDDIDAIAVLPRDIRQGQTRNCSPANPNSTSESASIQALGSLAAGDNDVTLIATEVPTNQWGIFITSFGLTNVPFGDGVLCLASPVGRILPAINSGFHGTLYTDLDLSAMPLPPGFAAPGDLWHYQGWFRDGTTVNFTDVVSVTFQ